MNTSGNSTDTDEQKTQWNAFFTDRAGSTLEGKRQSEIRLRSQARQEVALWNQVLVVFAGVVGKLAKLNASRQQSINATICSLQYRHFLTQCDTDQKHETENHRGAWCTVRIIWDHRPEMYTLKGKYHENLISFQNPQKNCLVLL